jgi:hypothetical protein
LGRAAALDLDVLAMAPRVSGQADASTEGLPVESKA